MNLEWPGYSDCDLLQPGVTACSEQPVLMLFGPYGPPGIGQQPDKNIGPVRSIASCKCRSDRQKIYSSALSAH